MPEFHNSPIVMEIYNKKKQLQPVLHENDYIDATEIVNDFIR